jgi:hypothetical protein
MVLCKKGGDITPFDGTLNTRIEYTAIVSCYLISFAVWVVSGKSSRSLEGENVAAGKQAGGTSFTDVISSNLENIFDFIQLKLQGSIDLPDSGWIWSVFFQKMYPDSDVTFYFLNMNKFTEDVFRNFHFLFTFKTHFFKITDYGTADTVTVPVPTYRYKSKLFYPIRHCDPEPDP